MKRHSLLAVVSAVLVLMLLISGAGLAQDDGIYQGVFTFNYPAGWEASVGGRGEGEQVTVTKDDFVINVYGPVAYNQILGGQTFDDDAAALAFFVERAGYEVGDSMEPTGANELARVNVSLPRRNSIGLASLVDLANGRTGVLVALQPEGRLDINLVQVYLSVLQSFTYPPDIVDIATSNDDFSTLVAAVQAAGLVDTLRGEGPFTVFAPTNEAFAAALETLGVSPADVMANTDLLTSILTYHVVPGAVTSDMLADGAVTTVQGDPVQVKVAGGVTVNGAHVVTADIIAGNGVVHVIDKVLLPPDVEATVFAAQFQELLKRNDTYKGRFNVQYAKGINLTEGQRGQDLIILSKNDAAVTIYGPDSVAGVLGTTEQADDAAKLAFFLERNNLEAGDVVESSAENVLAAQAISLPRRGQSGTAYLLDLGNGRVGVVTALAGRDGFSIALRDFAVNQVLTTIDYPADVVDVAMADPNFSILVQAIQAAGLVDTLRTEEVTVFAPTNQAFLTSLAGLNLSAEDVMGNTDLLTSILTYHVVPGTVLAADLTEGAVTTLNGQDVQITLGDAPQVNGVNISATDIPAYNGVIHAIDGVLLPVLCSVSTETVEGVDVRVGPGENRTRIAFLPTGVEVAVTGKYTAEGDVLWYQVDKFAAAPANANDISQAWVLAESVTVSGAGCSLVGDVEAPPIR